MFATFNQLSRNSSERWSAQGLPNYVKEINWVTFAIFYKKKIEADKYIQVHIFFPYHTWFSLIIGSFVEKGQKNLAFKILLGAS